MAVRYMWPHTQVDYSVEIVSGPTNVAVIDRFVTRN